MELLEQIKIVEELIDGVTELNGEYQSGWEENLKNAEELLSHLMSELNKERQEPPKQ